MPARRTDPGWGPWLGLGTACVLILSLTFALGMLVGRQWARQQFPPHPPVVAEGTRSEEDGSRRGPAGAARGRGGPGRDPATASPGPVAPGPAPARPAPAAARPDPPRQEEEKLTFYRTLTAPVGPVGVAPGGDERGAPPDPPGAAARGKGADRPALPPPPPAVRPSPPAPALQQVAPPKPRLTQETEEEARWTVQVGAFRSRDQAESLQRRLAGAGYDVTVTTAAAGAGPRYRVQVGSYASRSEAEQAAARVRSRGGLSTFVTLQ